jgi:hypothetical protein
MMRSNALITIFLALAAAFFFPATSMAKSTHRPARKTVPAGTPTHGKHTAEPTHSVHRHSPPAPGRVNTQQSSTHRRTRHTINSATRTRATHYKLTASASDPVAIHGTSRPEALNEPPLPSPAQKPESVSKPATVVGVVRRNSPRPQLPSVEEAAATPVILPSLYNKRGRLIVPPPLKGSREILVRQNQVADHEGLDRIQSDEDLLDMRNNRLLVSLPASNALQIDERLPANRRYCRPWVAQFLATMARAHYAQFHSPLQVNSAVRTVEFQQRLVHINGNAAPAEGDTASPHLTGQAIDIAKHGLSLTEIAWLRGYLLPLVQEGKVDVEEEFQQSCFHISVYRKYLPPAGTPSPNPAPSRHSETTALAAAIR